MSLTLILGEKKSGKTSFILEEIKKNKNSIIIVPEQTLFLYEKLILNELGEESFFNVKILSFKKLARKILSDDKNFNRIKLLDNDTKNLIIEKILLQDKDNLSSFKNSLSSPEFAEKLSAQISEFKKYLVECDILEEISKREDINKNLKDKLKDISYIYSKYSEKIKDVYLDLDDLLVSSANKNNEENLYCNYNIYIDSFTGFTGEEIYVIKSLLKTGNNVFVTLPYLKGRKGTGADINHTLILTEGKLEKIAQEEKVELKKTILEFNGIKNKEINFIKDNYDLLDRPLKFKDKNESINIYKCKNPKYECENLASKIVSDIKQKDAKLNEMAVIVPDIKEYLSLVHESLQKFSIPYYANEKKSVYDMPVAALLGNIFNIILSGNRMDVILGYLKSGYFFKGEETKIFAFEEFIKRTGIRAYHLMSKPFDAIIEEKKAYNFIIDNEEELKEVYEKAIKPVIDLKEKIKGAKNSKEYSYLLYEFFIKIDLDKTLTSYANDYKEQGDIIKGKQLIQVYNYILESMERTTLILSELKVPFNDYKNIIISSLKNKNIGSVPVIFDSVFVTEPMGFFNNGYKYIYILGANDGKIPSLNFGEGLISEEERLLLSDFGIELSMSYELKITENKLKVYDIITSPEISLAIFYSAYSKSATDEIESELVCELLEMFDIKIKNENIVYDTRRNLLKDTLSSFSVDKDMDNMAVSYLCEDEKYLKFIEDTLDSLNNPDFGNVKVDKKNISKLVGDTLRVSTTNMEKYNACAYSYFLRYILKAKEKEEFLINSLNLGSVIHLVLEKFSKKLVKDNKQFSDVDDLYIKKTLPEILEKAVSQANNGVFNLDVKGEVFKRKLWATAYKTINLLREHFIRGSFKTVGSEVDFGREDSELSGITFDAGEGRKIVLNGVIDRVDKFEKGGDEYIRIVDYKSSEHTLSFYEVIYGIKMQLAIYLMTVIGKEKIERIKPGGMLYLSLKSPMISISSPEEAEDIEARIRKKLTMKGFYLNTTDNALAMDSEFLENNKSDIVDLEVDNLGIPKDKNSLSIKEFEILMSKVRDNIEDGGKRIFDGKFPIRPIHHDNHTSCDYCPYNGVCMFDSENNNVVNIKKMSREEIFPK